jgi:catechol 2,3-dioxygenase-like lactoylglutathione lyase family enzyme
MTASLDHVGVVVSDLDRALGFWRDLLGLPVTGQGEVD